MTKAAWEYVLSHLIRCHYFSAALLLPFACPPFGCWFWKGSVSLAFCICLHTIGIMFLEMILQIPSVFRMVYSSRNHVFLSGWILILKSLSDITFGFNLKKPLLKYHYNWRNFILQDVWLIIRAVYLYSVPQFGWYRSQWFLLPRSSKTRLSAFPVFHSCKLVNAFCVLWKLFPLRYYAAELIFAGGGGGGCSCLYNTMVFQRLMPGWLTWYDKVDRLHLHILVMLSQMTRIILSTTESRRPPLS